MNRSQATAKRKTAQRLDTLLALPLHRFRCTLADLTGEELSALAERIGVQRVKSRWERGGHGIARHRSPLTLALLERRDTALRQERATRLTEAPTQIRLLPPQADVQAVLFEEQAA